MAGFTVTRRGLGDRRGEKVTSIETVALEANVLDPRWDFPGDNATGAAACIQAIMDYYFQIVANYGGSATIRVPPLANGYLLEKALIRYPRIRLVGGQAQYGQRASGSMASRFVANPSGAFTNTSNVGGAGAPSAAALLKQATTGVPATSWDHGATVENIAFDPNGVAGLAGMYSWMPGENTFYNRLTCEATVAVARTVTDAVTNGTNDVTSATAAFTADDVNAVVTGTRIPSGTKIDRVVSATEVILNQAASGSGSGGSLTINRPTDAFTWDGGAAHGSAGIIRGAANSGAVVRLKNQASGPWRFADLSADNCGGGLLRISNGASAADPLTVLVEKFKAENDSAAGVGSSALTMDPVFLLDNCGMVALDVLSGTALTGYASRDIVRIDQPIASQGGPSVHLGGIEAGNPFNNGYTNLIRDTSTGKALVATPTWKGFTVAGLRRMYPKVLWGRDLLVGGGASIPTHDSWQSGGAFYGQPVWCNPAGTWLTTNAVGAPAPWIYGIIGYVNSGAVGDGAAFIENLSPGTWNLSVAYAKEPALGIITLDVGVNVPRAPAPPVTSVTTSGGTMSAGNFGFYATLINANGETAPSVSFAQAVVANGTLTVQSPKPTDPSVTGWNLYATQVGAAGSATKQNSQPIAIGTDYTFTANPTNTGGTPPILDTAGTWIAIGTIDLYVGTATTGTTDYTGIVIPDHMGPALLRFRVTGKNASSSGYQIAMSGREWQRTS